MAEAEDDWEADEGPDGYVVFGTAVEVPESDEPVKKRVPIQDQVATDERGRRRFHGAFTGGFSAGHWNTVGSAEGWQPSQFVSSRQGARREARPEDFMDEEDLSEFGIAPRRVKATGQFEAEPQQQRAVATEGLLAGAEIKDLVLPAPDTAGIRLLKLLGWKEGQGVGPRKERPQLSAEDLSEEDVLAETEAAMHRGRKFAPKDVVITEFAAKDNVFGIGYRGLRPQDMDITGPAKRGMAGFGVGALEEDDEDIYHEESRDHYNRVVDDDHASKRPRHVFRKKTNKGPAGLQAQLEICIRGFAKASVQLAPPTHYPPPVVPADFDPQHKFTTPGPAFEQHSTGAQKAVSADERARILGEEPAVRIITPAFIPPPPRPPPADYVPGRPIQPQPPPGMSAESAMQPGVFRPFSKTPLKEARYLQFLDGKPVEFPPHMDAADQRDEFDEFLQAARLYRPLAGAMANRFVTAQLSTAPGAAKRAKEAAAAEEDAVVDERKQAVESKMFGKLTRRVYEWHPAALLCKRMDVPDPFKKSGITGLVLPEDEVVVKHRILDDHRTMAETMPAMAAAIAAKAAAAAEAGDDEVIYEGAPEPPRPEMDIFKAIFSGSSSSSSEDEAEDDRMKVDAPPPAAAAPAAAAPRQPQQGHVAGGLPPPPPPPPSRPTPMAQAAAVAAAIAAKAETKSRWSDAAEDRQAPLLPTPADAAGEVVWEERSAHFADRDREDRAGKHKKEKKSKKKSKKKKSSKKSSKKSHRDSDDDSSSDSDSDPETAPSTKDLLAKIRGARKTGDFAFL